MEGSPASTCSNPSQTTQTAYQDWSNGETRPFTFRYIRSSNQAQFVNQNGNAVSYSPSNRGPYNDLFIRIRGASNETMTISNLTLNGTALSESLSISNGIRVLRITNVPFASGFVLQGSARMTWTGIKPSSNNQYVELRVGQVT
ncbi:choice-of-anchor W domain-containing protein [Haladaptatus caseinilyticus]|uniref:choice-of-anchor W domain-containing protein n=1 Tax=Haladaptatus caseinilyticus TaxID=2993314 RepID=UPI0038994812